LSGTFYQITSSGLLQLKKKKKQKNWKPKQQRGNDQIKQEDNNKEENNANPTMREMNMTQVDCCKEMFIYKKKKTQTTSGN
jgi:hypothetical protein